MPSKGFSLSFFKRNPENGKLQFADEIGEYFFLNGPTSYEESFPQRISVDPTFRGFTVTDFGNDVSRIRLEGEFHIYYYAAPQVSVGGSADLATDISTQATNFALDFAANAMTDILPIPGVTVRTGKMEFFDFMGLLHSIRKDGNFIGNDIQSKEIVAKGLFQSAKPGTGKFNYAEYGIIYRDYERKRYVEVVPSSEGFTVSRSVDDTNTFKYSMSWVGLKDEAQLHLDGAISDIIEKTQFINPTLMLANIVSTIGSILQLPLVLSGALLSITGFVKNLLTIGDKIQDEFVNAKKNLTADGKQLSKDFEEIKKSVKKSLGIKDKKSIYDRIIAQANYNDKMFDYYSEYWNKFKKDCGEFQAQAENIFSAAGVIILNPPPNPDSPLENAALIAYWDSTSYIDSEVYDYSWATYYEGSRAVVMIYFSGLDNNFAPYFANGGETFSSIANSILGDSNLATALAEYNNLGINTDLAGIVLKIPTSRPTLRTYSNSVLNNPAALEERLLGQDLALSNSRGILTDSTGDLAILNGELSYANNMIDMLDFPVGSLPFWKFWGNPAVIGQLATDWDQELYIEQICQALRNDPRTSQATAEKFVQDGNVGNMEIKVISIWGKESHYFSL